MTGRHLSLRALGAAAILLAGLAACDDQPPGEASGPGQQASHSYFVYATNERSGDLTIINGATLQPVATRPLGKRPRGITVGPKGANLYIALSGSPIGGPGVDESQLPPADKSADGIGVFDLGTSTITRIITGVSDPEAMAVGKDGKLYITSEDEGLLVIKDLASGRTEASLPVGREPEGVSLTPDGAFAYVTSEGDNQVSIVDTEAQTVVKRLPVGERPRNTAFSPDGDTAYVLGEFDSSITVIATQDKEVIRRETLTDGDDMLLPMDVGVSPDGKTLYITTGRGGKLLAVDADTLHVIWSLQVGERPWGLVVSPDGERVFTANGPSNDVTVVQVDTRSVLARVPAGDSPWGVALVTTGN